MLVLAAALAAFAACVDVLGDPDLFWHIRLGRWILDNHAVPHAELFSFTAAGSPMTAHEWGSEVLFTLLAQVGGLLLVAMAMGLVAWSALLALGLRSRQRGASAVAIAVALLAGARAAEPVLGTRPQVITVALVCWTLLIAERHLMRGGRLVWALAPVTLVWANLHAGFVLGIGALALTVGLEALRRWLGRPGAAPWRRIETLALSVGAAALLACLNPNGPGLYRYAMETSSSERAKPITEWQMPNFADPSNLGLLFLMVSFGRWPRGVPPGAARCRRGRGRPLREHSSCSAVSARARWWRGRLLTRRPWGLARPTHRPRGRRCAGWTEYGSWRRTTPAATWSNSYGRRDAYSSTASRRHWAPPCSTTTCASTPADRMPWRCCSRAGPTRCSPAPARCMIAWLPRRRGQRYSTTAPA